ncbi:MAG: molecular chaperone HtpG, partial [Spirochaetes bacterium]|nr:molecular chaperone HtpG [Spirochaetota bacterium]
IHLDVEVPFRLKGILYFPKLKHELDSSKGRIKLYCNQVFVSDHAKEIIPEFLTLLQGTIDAPDIPLNVSRSYLQNDPYVRKISEHITKKVADKLNSLFKKDRETYEKYWDDINIFVKYGALNNEKFYEKVKDIFLYKTTDKVYKTLEEYKEKNKGVNKEKDGKQQILYATDEEQQISLINMVKAHKMEAIVFNSIIDIHFIQFLEMKDQTVNFIRIDSDTNEHLAEEEAESKIVDESNKTSDDRVKEIFEKVLKKDENSKITVKIQALKTENTSGMIVFSEFMRRFKEMNSMFRAGDKENDLFGDHTLLVNSKNHLVKRVVELNEKSENSDQIDKLVNHIYDLALLAQNNLKGQRLADFIERSHHLLED